MSNIIPLPKKIAGAKPPVKRNELILVMANRLIEQARQACNKSADALEQESQAIDAELLKLVKEKPVASPSWNVETSSGWSGKPTKGDLYVRCAEVRYSNVKVGITEDLMKRMFAHHKATAAHAAEFGWLGVHRHYLRPTNHFGKSTNQLLSVAKEKARALLGEQPVVVTSSQQRVAQMLADPEFTKATDLFIKRLANQPKRLAG